MSAYLGAEVDKSRADYDEPQRKRGDVESCARSAGAYMNQTAATVDCKHEPAVFEPVINRKRCEGKKDCVRVCPYSVFEVRKLTTDERRAIPFLARLKMTLHGDKQAFAGPRPGLPRVRIVRSCVPGTRDHTGARRETCLIRQQPI